MELSLSEMLLVAVVAVLFIGPKELPAVARGIAKLMRGMRSLAGEVRKAFDDMAQESGIKETADELKAEMRLIRGDDGELYESYDIPSLEEKKRDDA